VAKPRRGPEVATKRRARWAPRVAGAVIALALVGGVIAWRTMVWMPGDDPPEPLPAPSETERAAAVALRGHVNELAGAIGERNDDHPDALRRAADYVERELVGAGYEVTRQPVPTHDQTFDNLEVTLAGAGKASEIVVVGAHYDSAEGAPGANDNASGVAALLVLAERLRTYTPARTLRLVAFVNEEPPHFKTDRMGSLVYARACKARGDDVRAMLSLETMGYYSDVEGSQKYPAPLSLFYPSSGSFIAVVGDVNARPLVHEVVAGLRASGAFPTEGGALPGSLPGISWSDHWAFWEQGYPGVMLTDTAPFRYPDYHEPTDLPDKVDYDKLARVVGGVESVVRALTGS
jgi:hypothetical protein